jgi:carbonic anhydrase
MKNIFKFLFSIIICLKALTAQTESQNKNSVLDFDRAIDYLIDGNKRFVENIQQHPHQHPQRRIKLAKEGQKPMATIISCSDSRVPPEIIFDVGIGDIFVIRTAGNVVVDKTVLGSVEYGALHLKTPLIMVLGHTKCGAVTAAVKNEGNEGNISAIIKSILPAIEKAKEEKKSLSQDKLILKTIKTNIFNTIEEIFKNSPEIRKMVREAKLKIIGAIYDLETGKVTNLSVHPAQNKIINKLDGIVDE